MLETPGFMSVLFSGSFKSRISAVYLDEAHCIHEQHTWRPSFTRLYKIHEIIGDDVPLVPISAMLPERYRRSLIFYTGLKADYSLINLGNFRPELSVVVLHMEHDPSTFLDLAFTLRLGTRSPSELDETLIYSDKISLLTEMYWWYYTRLASMNLPVHLVDIIHTGLSDISQKRAIEDFTSGCTKILLGTEIIGAGVDFPKVRWVIQYCCRGLTLVQWEQRRGCGGRRSGDISTGIILVEKSMAPGGDLTVNTPRFEDPALLDLIYSTTLPFPLNCCNPIIDKWLENPLRAAGSDPHSRCHGCGNCLPELLPGKDHRFIMYEPPSNTSIPRLQNSDKKRIYSALVEWRDATWRTDWMDNWPMFGPHDILPDSDLEDIVKLSRSISSEDELIRKLHTVHALVLGPSLFCAMQQIVLDICGPLNDPIDSPLSRHASPEPDSTDSEIAMLLTASRKRKRTKTKPITLTQYETLMEF